MEYKIWAKTFLSIYRCLSRLAKSIDMHVEIRAKSCFYKNISSISLCGTTKVVDDLTSLINKKIILINIKCLVEQMLESLPSKNARFLILKYIEGRTFEEAAKSLEISPRTAMRWDISVLAQCGDFLKKIGHTEQSLCEFVGHEKWILAIKNKLCDEANKHASKIAYFVVQHEAEKDYRRFLI